LLATRLQFGCVAIRDIDLRGIRDKRSPLHAQAVCYLHVSGVNRSNTPLAALCANLLGLRSFLIRRAFRGKKLRYAGIESFAFRGASCVRCARRFCASCQKLRT
jgi:hypothetical protein